MLPHTSLSVPPWMPAHIVPGAAALNRSAAMATNARDDNCTALPAHVTAGSAIRSRSITSPGDTATKMLSVKSPQPLGLVTSTTNQVSSKGVATGLGEPGSSSAQAGLQSTWDHAGSGGGTRARATSSYRQMSAVGPPLTVSKVGTVGATPTW